MIYATRFTRVAEGEIHAQVDRLPDHVDIAKTKSNEDQDFLQVPTDDWLVMNLLISVQRDRVAHLESSKSAITNRMTVTIEGHVLPQVQFNCIKTAQGKWATYSVKVG